MKTISIEQSRLALGNMNPTCHYMLLHRKRIPRFPMEGNARQKVIKLEDHKRLIELQKIGSKRGKKFKKHMVGRSNFTTKLEGVNSRLMSSHKTGHFFLSPKYRSCKEELIRIFGQDIKTRNLDKSKVVVYVSAKQWRGDLDNVSKIIMDALVQAGIIADDSRQHVVGKSFIATDSDYSTVEVYEVPNA